MFLMVWTSWLASKSNASSIPAQPIPKVRRRCGLLEGSAGEDCSWWIWVANYQLFGGGPKPYQTWYPGSHIKIVGCCDMYLPFHLWDHHRYLAPICVPNLTILHPFQEMHFSHFEISVQEWAIPAIPATTQSLLIMYVKISANWERQAMCQDHAQSFQVKSPLVEEKIPTFHAEKSCPWMVNSNFMRLLAKFQEEFREDTAHAKAGATLSTSASMVHILDADVWIEISTYLP